MIFSTGGYFAVACMDSGSVFLAMVRPHGTKMNWKRILDDPACAL